MVRFRSRPPARASADTSTSCRVQTIIPTVFCFVAGFASSLITGGLPEQAEYFGVSEVVMNLVVVSASYFSVSMSLHADCTVKTVRVCRWIRNRAPLSVANVRE